MGWKMRFGFGFEVWDGVIRRAFEMDMFVYVGGWMESMCGVG